MEVLERVTNKVGPLPAWAWAAIPAGLYVAYSYYKASREPTIIDPTIDGGAEGTSAEDYGINTGGAFLPGYGTTPTGSSNAVPPVDMPRVDNQAWFRRALNWMIGEGVLSTDAVTALNAYIYGTPDNITSTQLQALQRAIAVLGGAPEPAFIPGVIPPSTTPTPPKPGGVKAPNPVWKLQARNMGKGRINVSWQPGRDNGSPITRYYIQVNKGLAIAKQANTLALSADITGLTAGIYSVFVWAVNAKGPSGRTAATVRVT